MQEPDDDIDRLALQWAHEYPDTDLSGLVFTLRLTRIGKLMELSFAAFCREHFGLQMAEMRLLLALRRNGRPYAMRPTDLFRALLITSGAVTKQVDRMCALAFVERTTDSERGGGFMVRLTRGGKAVADRAMRHFVKEASISHSVGELLDQCSASERQVVEGFVARLLKTVEAAAKDHAPRK